MIDLIKKTVLAGIGATVLTKEKAEAALQEWVKQGRVSAAEASAFATRIAEDGRKEFESASSELSERLKEALQRSPVASRAQVEALEARVKALEERLARAEAPVAS